MFPIRDTQPRSSIPLLTLGLIVLNCYVFWKEVNFPPELMEGVFFQLGLVPRAFWDWRWAEVHGIDSGFYPLITSQFLHGGVLHLVSNMWSLWIFGDNVEDRMGKVRFIVFYVVVGVAAGLFHLFSAPSSEIPTIGASGAVAGVMGAYFVSFPRSKVEVLIPIFIYPLFVEVPAVFFMIIWFYSQFYSGLAAIGTATQGGIAWWAHVGGFVTGILLLPLFSKRKRIVQRAPPWRPV
jgi:membrane associated rhomboid family serine protease